MKYQCEDVTFFIPVRLDTVCRLENLLVIIELLHRYLKTHIFVLEADAYNNGLLSRLLPKDVEYRFVEDPDPVFYRTHYINEAVRAINTRFVAVWDADVIVAKEQIADSIDKLRTSSIDVAFPYNGNFLDTSFIIRECFMENGHSIDFLKKNQEKMYQIYGPVMCGGCFILLKEKYVYSGLENENFYGWGCEDSERITRWETLGYRIYRSNGVLYHLSHPRQPMNSKFGSARHERKAKALLEFLKDRSRVDITGDK